MNLERAVLMEECLNGDAEEVQRVAFDRALADDAELRSEWIAHRRLVVQMHGMAPRTALSARIRELIIARKPSRRMRFASRVRARIGRRQRSIVGGRWAMVAAAVIALGLGFWWMSSAHGRQPQATVAGRTVAVGSMIGGDEPLIIEWDDGSRARLVPGSQGRITPDGIALDVGVIECHVAPRKMAPFRITTSDGPVSVLGTRFKVTADADGSQIAVEEGRVSAADRILGGGQQARLRKGMAHDEVTYWKFPDRGQVDIGMPMNDGWVSGIWSEDGSESPCLRISKTDTALWRWRPGMTLRVSVRLPGGGPLKLQCYDQDQAKNHFVDRLVTGSNWQRLIFPLDELRPYDHGSLPSNGHECTVVVFIRTSGTEAFEARDLEITGGL